jgi:hypothetical protein
MIELEHNSAFTSFDAYVHVYNNSLFSNDATALHGVSVLKPSITNTVIQNNLGYAPNSSLQGMVEDSGTGTVTCGSCNSSNSQVKSTSPNFTATPPVATSDWKPTSGSPYPIGGGVAVPVWSDFFQAAEPATRDIGAVAH